MNENIADIRWIQRFNNYQKALKQLERFLTHDQLNEMEIQGLIKAFEYTYELAWKTLQDLLKEKGYSGIAGPKPVIEQCFADSLIIDGKGWMKMHQSRNLTSHTYEEETAKAISEDIRHNYFDLFKDLKVALDLEQQKYINNC